jgi:hypothetical protein
MDPNIPMETTNLNQPPVITPPSRAGRVGMWLSLVAPVVLVLMLALKPG